MAWQNLSMNSNQPDQTLNPHGQGGADPESLEEPQNEGQDGVKQFNDFLTNNNMK